MNINSKTTGLGLLLPAALNPALAVTLGVGVIGFGIYRLLGDNEECEKPKALPEPSPTVGTVVEDLISDDANSVETVAVVELPQTADFDQHGADQDDTKQKMIRDAMSELGKRSAAARARKKAEASATDSI
jgi:hypothetical protein